MTAFTPQQMRELADSQSWYEPEIEATLRAAADEVDRLREEMLKALREIDATNTEVRCERDRAERYERDLARFRAVIENAPHGPLCRWDRTDALAYRGQAANCTCWKSETL